MERTDEELIVAYLDGEEGAFAELVERHLTTVYSFAVRFVGNDHEAEDISQETFLKAWRSIGKYRKEHSKFKTWLLRIARNTAIDHLRKRKNIAFSEFEGPQGENILAETVPDPGELPDELLAKMEDAHALNRMLEQLSAKHREILLLHYTNHLTFEEIGELLGEPQNTVKSRHHRALLTLRKIVGLPAPKKDQ